MNALHASSRGQVLYNMRAADAFGAWNPSTVVQEGDRNGDVRTMLPEFRPPDQVPRPGFSPLAAYSGSAGSGTRRPLRKLIPRPPPGPQQPVPQQQQQQQQQPVSQPLTFGESAGSAPSDPPSSSTLSYERSTASSTASRGGGTKRSRKRNKAEPPLPPRASPAPPRLQPMPSDAHLEMPSSSLQTAGPIALGNSPFGPRIPMEQHSQWERPSSQTPLAPIPFGGYSPMQLAGGQRMATAYVNEVASAESGPGPNGGEGAGAGGRIDRRYHGHGFGSFRFPFETGLPAMSGSMPDMHAPSINVGSGGEGPSSFMDRAADRAAAASAPPPFLQREAQGFHKARGGGGGEGAGVGLTSGNLEVFQDFPEPGGVLSHGLSGTTSCTSTTTAGPSPPSEVRDDSRRSYTPVAGVANYQLSASGSGVDEATPDDDDRTGELVTLSLLPDTPSYQKSSTEVIRPTSLEPNTSTFLALRMGCDSRHWEAAAAAGQNMLAASVKNSDELVKLGIFNGAYEQQRQEEDSKAPAPGAAVVERRTFQVAEAQRDFFGESSSAEPSRTPDGHVSSDWPFFIDRVAKGAPIFRSDANEDNSRAAGTAMVDVAYLEEKYSGNEPMILEDENTGAHLWENQAYKKKVESKRKAGALYMDMDPIGSRYRKDVFQFWRPEGPVVNAVLFGSLTKFMRLDVDELDKDDSPRQQQHPSPVRQNITVAADQKDAIIPKGVQGGTSHQISRPVPRRASDF